MHNPLLIKTFLASGAISARRAVTFGSADGVAVQASANSQKVFGVSQALDVADGANCDVVTHGIAQVLYGGSITRGDYLTVDSLGRVVTANFAAGSVIYILGIAQKSGVVGDIGSVIIAPGQLANESQVVVADVTLTTAQVKALNATPITILAAPGAGKAYVPVWAQAMLDYESAAYDGIASGEDLALKYTDANGTVLAQFETTGFLDQASDQVRYATPSQSGNTNLTPVANAAVVAHMLTGEIATGNSPVKIRIAYRLIDTAW